MERPFGKFQTISQFLEGKRSIRQHFEDVENSCPMVALPTDVGRSGISAKRAFETVFRAMVSVLERSMVQNGRRRRSTAQAIAALSIGGMIVARTVADRALADELRNACMAVALDLGGWTGRLKPERIPAITFDSSASS